jgi:phosphoglycolate phosphatase
MYDLVLFDLDGTLVNTAPDIADAVNLVLAARNLKPRSLPWMRDRIGHGSRNLLLQAWQAAHRRKHPPEAPVDELLDEFGRHYAQRCGKRGRLYRDAATTLTTLRNAGVKTALLTNKEERFVRFLLEVHGLDDDFDAQVCGDSLPAKKPDPLPVRHVLARLRVAPERALLVGDSTVDVATARNAGIAVWAVDYGYNQRRPIAEAHPDRVIGRLGEVLEPFAERIAATAGGYAPRASSSSLYLRSNPRN